MRRIGLAVAVLVATGVVVVVVSASALRDAGSHASGGLVALSAVGTRPAATPTAAGPSAASVTRTGASSGGIMSPPAQVVGLGSSPPGSDGITADGLTAWGFATGTASDATNEPGIDLLHQAFEDAASRAQRLASASGVTLGKILALTSSSSPNVVGFPCAQPALGAPQPAPAASTLGGSPLPTVVAPLPPVPCPVISNVVVWVVVRYQIG